MSFIRLRKFLSISNFLGVFTMKGYWILSTTFFFIFWDDELVFILYAINMVYCIPWFWVLNHLCTQDKSHLAIVSNPFYVLLDWFASIFWRLVYLYSGILVWTFLLMSLYGVTNLCNELESILFCSTYFFGGAVMEKSLWSTGVL